MNLLKLNTKDIAIDLGTTNVIVSVSGRGIVLTERNLVAKNPLTGEIIAVGNKANDLLNAFSENIVGIEPFFGGKIVNLEAAEYLIKYMTHKIFQRYGIAKPRVLVSVPNQISEVEERAIVALMLHSGAKEVYLVNSIFAGALGIGIDISKPEGNMILDIGEGKAELAIISLMGLVNIKKLEYSGSQMNEEIIEYLKRSKAIAITKDQATNLRRELGSAERLVSEIEIEIDGRDVETGVPKKAKISSKDIEYSMRDSVSNLVESTKNMLVETPPELLTDIYKNGINIIGSGAKIRNLDNVIASKTNVKTYISTELNAVAQGLSKIINRIDDYKEIIRTNKE